MTLSAGLRKTVLLFHVVTSVGLLGSVASFLLLAVRGVTSTDMAVQSAVYTVLPHITQWLVIPMLVLSLVVGLISGFGTPWGLVRHYWLIAKLALTVLSLAVLIVQMPTIFELAREASSGGIVATDFSLQMRLVVHASGGLAVLVIIAWLSIYKPRGQTPFNF